MFQADYFPCLDRTKPFDVQQAPKQAPNVQAASAVLEDPAIVSAVWKKEPKTPLAKSPTQTTNDWPPLRAPKRSADDETKGTGTPMGNTHMYNAPVPSNQAHSSSSHFPSCLPASDGFSPGGLPGGGLPTQSVPAHQQLTAPPPTPSNGANHERHSNNQQNDYKHSQVMYPPLDQSAFFLPDFASRPPPQFSAPNAVAEAAPCDQIYDPPKPKKARKNNQKAKRIVFYPKHSPIYPGHPVAVNVQNTGPSAIPQQQQHPATASFFQRPQQQQRQQQPPQQQQNSEKKNIVEIIDNVCSRCGLVFPQNSSPDRLLKHKIMHHRTRT